jgi:hypothetical protein
VKISSSSKLPGWFYHHTPSVDIHHHQIAAAYKLPWRSKGLRFRQMTTTYHAMGRPLVTMRATPSAPPWAWVSLFVLLVRKVCQFSISKW